MQPHRTASLSIAAMSVALLAPFGGSAQNLSEINLQKTVAQESRFTVAPGDPKPLVIQTLPDSVCDLHMGAAANPKQTLRLYANPDGYVRVHVRAKETSEELAHLQLDCQANGKLTTYPLTFRASDTPTEDMPAPLAVLPAPKDAKLLPALTDDEARQLSDRDLAERGYAPRPDPATSPENYAAWLKLVSHAFTVVEPHSVSRSDISHKAQTVEAGTENSSNWSGYELRSSSKSYLGVQSQWNIPPIPLGESNTITYSAFWVGLDGDGTSDLIQAGTEQDFVDILFLQFASYSAWTELVPNQPTESEITNLSVNPNDSVLTFVWVGDSNGTIDPNGAYGWFLFGDFTTNQETYVHTALGSTKFKGTEAEWIMERPKVNGAFADLSLYVIASMTGAYALTTKEQYVPYSSTGNLQLTMYENYSPADDDNVLSVAIPINSTQIDYFWQNFH